jgi:ribulose-phosphate 3-epimerase
MKPEIIPAILVKTPEDAEARLAIAKKRTRFVQLDVLDHTLVPNRSWHDPKHAARWPTSPSLELHLMVRDPKTVAEAWRHVPAVKRIIWHVEAPIDHAHLIAWAKKQGWQAGLAQNPDTPTAALVPFLRLVDTVLVMGVTPGWSGQPFQPAAYRHLEELHKLAPKLPLGVDGGVTARNIPALRRRGATRLCLASAIFSKADPSSALQRLVSSLS